MNTSCHFFHKETRDRRNTEGFASLCCLRGALVPTFRLAHSVTRRQAVAPLPLRSVVLNAMGGIKMPPIPPNNFSPRFTTQTKKNT